MIFIKSREIMLYVSCIKQCAYMNEYYMKMNYVPITVAGCCSGDGVEDNLRTASRRKNSTLAISVATQ